MARKTGLGRTDPRTTGTLTSRNYRCCARHVRACQSHSVSSTDSFHSRFAVCASAAFFNGLVTLGLPNCLNFGARYVPGGRSLVAPMMLDLAAVFALCGKSRKKLSPDDQPRKPVLWRTMLVSAPPGSTTIARTPLLASSLVNSMTASLDCP